jgi:lysyl-tRNA synthetase, class II
MARLENDVFEHRLAVRDALLQQGINPYPQEGHRSHSTIEALAEEHGTTVIVAGRLQSIRTAGKIAFLDIHDEAGRLQVVLKEDEVEGFENLKNYDRGDYIRANGTRFQTKTGEESVLAHNYEMLAKALRPLPNARIGFKNEEERYRRRSVDMSVNAAVAEVFKARSRVINSVRQTLVDGNFIEVETPTLQPLYGGANARPFTTHIHAYDLEMYLRISPELYLKYLIMGNMGKVFEITKNFRNEGVDRSHNPEFTMMECYASWWDYTDMMDLTEAIYTNAALAATGGSKITFQGTEVDFEKKWPRIPMKQAILKYLHFDVDSMTDNQIQKAIRESGLKYNTEWKRGLGIAKLFEACEPHLIQPTFIIDMPKETTSLCKPHREDPELIERFEPYIMGMEVGNAYTELNDPVLQRQFWEEERANQENPHPLDEDFITAMEYGMPPTGGLGLGIDRMVMLLTNQTKIRDVIPFPTMRPRKEL